MLNHRQSWKQQPQKARSQKSKDWTLPIISPMAPQESVPDLAGTPYKNGILPTPMAPFASSRRCSVSNKVNFIFLYVEEYMPTHNLSVWTALTMFLARSLIRVLFIILLSAPGGRKKATRKQVGIRKRKKQSAEPPVHGISWGFLLHAFQCLTGK